MDRDIKKVSKISEDVINLAFLKYIKAYNECVFFKLCATPNSKKLAGGGGGGGIHEKLAHIEETETK